MPTSYVNSSNGEPKLPEEHRVGVGSLDEDHGEQLVREPRGGKVLLTVGLGRKGAARDRQHYGEAHAKHGAAHEGVEEGDAAPAVAGTPAETVIARVSHHQSSRLRPAASRSIAVRTAAK